jgi:hypothetical protein
MSLVLEERVAAFVAGPAISIAVASRDVRHRAALFKAVACRVSGRRDRITLLVDAVLAHDVVRCLRSGFPIAAVFSEPATHRTLQLKGERAEVEPATAADLELARERHGAIVEHITGLDYPREAVQCYFHYVPAQLVAVHFAPTAAFEQTPGPGAGTALGRGA